MTETKKREIRLSDQLWEAAIAKAHADGVTVSGLVRRWLTDYVSDDSPSLTELGSIARRLTEIHRTAKAGVK